MIPTWKVVRLEKRKLGIQCPRKACGKKAVVTRDWLRLEVKVGEQTKTYHTRPCPYCFKTAEIPEEFRGR